LMRYRRAAWHWAGCRLNVCRLLATLAPPRTAVQYATSKPAILEVTGGTRSH